MSKWRYITNDIMQLVHKKVAYFVVIFRVIAAILINTWYVPDEYWQSIEVAHRLVFGYGYHTWEWRLGLRNAIYPLLFVPFYMLVWLFGVESYDVLVITPRIIQALMTALGDYHLYSFANDYWNSRTAMCVLYCHLFSWFSVYCGGRTLTNTAEMALLCVALRVFPWKETDRDYKRFVIVSAFSVLIRPTAIIPLAPLGIKLILKANKEESDKVKEKKELSKHKKSRDKKRNANYREEDEEWVVGLVREKIGMLLYATVLGVCLLIADMLLNGLLFGEFRCSAWIFIQWNVLWGVGSFYGTHPWWWYLLEGLPVVIGLNVVPFVLGTVRKDSPCWFFIGIIAWTTFVYSFFPHKEFRFLLPLVPLINIVCGCYLDSVVERMWKRTVAFIIFYNIAVTFYFSFIHQRGTVDVMSWLHADVREREDANLLFLMPCHSTPYYSHIHREIPMRFLTCEPNIQNVPDYQDEAEIFYEDPKSWLVTHWDQATTHVIFFDKLLPWLQKFLLAKGFVSCAHFYHTHFPEGYVSENVLVYCR